MILSRKNIKHISFQTGLVIPGEKIFSLPEKVLQFGTGVLLRGLPDYFIDKANRQGIFNGRIVVIKSTQGGGADAFGQQDGLYTLIVRGIENNVKVEETIINSSISRVISARDNWEKVLQCAHDPNLQIIISNTTEVGITLEQDDIHLSPPKSFPGKLLAFLFARYKAFKESKESGMVIIPTELITDNGTKLLSIVLELAKMNKLDEVFMNWLKTENHFCNSLVDRIVPGKLPEQDKISMEQKLGYSDELMIMAESFRLWVLESEDERVKNILSFSHADEGMLITPDIGKFRELKLRLLNGTHSFVCGLAYLAGFKTVKEAMEDHLISSVVQNLMMNEIAVAMADDSIPYQDACNFAAKVMDRFRNPYIDHRWMSISIQYSLKMKMRNIPLLIKHYSKTAEAPELMALGFAAFLLFMKSNVNSNGQYFGRVNDSEYWVQDEYAGYFAEKWKTSDGNYVVDSVLADKNFWDAELDKLNGFSDLVKSYIDSLQQNGVMQTIRGLQLQKTEV